MELFLILIYLSPFLLFVKNGERCIQFTFLILWKLRRGLILCLTPPLWSLKKCLPSLQKQSTCACHSTSRFKKSWGGVQLKVYIDNSGRGGCQSKDYVDYGGGGESAKRLCWIMGGGRGPGYSKIGFLQYKNYWKEDTFQ